MLRMLPLVLAAAGLVAIPAFAQEAGDPEIVVEGEKERWDPAQEKKKRVCKRTVATGSIMPKVTCRTKGEWDEITARSVADVERLKAERIARGNTQGARENPP